MNEIGVYNVSIRKMDGEEIVKNYNTAYANQYSVEYQFSDTQTDLATFTKQAGGKEITLEDDIWQQKQEAVLSKVSLTVPLLIIAMLLFLFDIIVRRFSVDILFYLKGVASKLTGKRNTKRSSKIKRIKGKKLEKNRSQNTDVKHVNVDNTMDDSGSVKENFDGLTFKKQNNRIATEQNEKLDMNALLKKKQDRN